ncbi:conserved hypothetical protein [Theileria equi strain WA]|uniref:Uncharacterized protein n=1 Tax=Theileria equi strain WA TaxID=1537102 RepID=L1LGL6_THEEQ|nr:conserved hypothetical protein [Theileria equi strain WA]EKX74400.1 conserved hypothetical protein [Theileria equi strain WA]|eukprot:XP_004833852.1 conserved hypothetical protein [Theileria equi strain WA]
MATDDSTKTDENTTQRRWIVFMIGMTMLQVILLALTACAYAINRLKLPYGSSLGMFDMTGNSIKLANTVGIGVIFLIAIAYPGHMNYMNLMSTVIWVLFTVDLTLLIVFAVGSEPKNSVLYYSILVLSALIYGFSQISCIKTYVDDVPYVIVGMSMISISVFFYHILFLIVSSIITILDINYWIVVGQMVYVVLMAGSSAILWTFTGK